MLTFERFVLIEMQHNMIKGMLMWGVIHPKSGKIINGHDHGYVGDHKELISGLSKKDPNTPAGDYAQWGYVRHPSRSDHSYIYIRNVKAKNRESVLKSYHDLPHATDRQVYVNGTHFGNRQEMYNHIKSRKRP